MNLQAAETYGGAEASLRPFRVRPIFMMEIGTSCFYKVLKFGSNSRNLAPLPRKLLGLQAPVKLANIAGSGIWFPGPTAVVTFRSGGFGCCAVFCPTFLCTETLDTRVLLQRRSQYLVAISKHSRSPLASGAAFKIAIRSTSTSVISFARAIVEPRCAAAIRARRSLRAASPACVFQ
jgi:hypothetical protein